MLYKNFKSLIFLLVARLFNKMYRIKFVHGPQFLVTLTIKLYSKVNNNNDCGLIGIGISK